MPRLLLIFPLITLMYTSSLGQIWNPLGSGLDYEPYATFEDTVNGVLYVGGCFSVAGGNSINGIAQWNGNSWSAVGAGIDFGCTNDFEVYNNELYAGGDFFPPTSGINHIGRWDGINWTDVPPSGGQVLAGLIRNLETYQGELYAGGIIFSPSEGIVKYDGANWSAVGGGINIGGVVDEMKVFNGDLYVAGDFDSVGVIPVNNVAKWDGNSWMPVGNGINDYVLSLEEYNGELYAGTRWGSGIFKWDGSNWANVGVANPLGQVNQLKTFNGYLYAGGFFTMIDGDTLLKIAKYDGNNWTAIGNGMNDDVTTLSVFQNDLYAGGRFTVADTTNVNYMARWGQLVGINPPTVTINTKIYPNPTTGIFTVDGTGPMDDVEVLDIFGRKVHFNINHRTFNISHLPKGVYIVRVGDAVRKLILN